MNRLNLKISILKALMPIVMAAGIIFLLGQTVNAQSTYNFTSSSGLSTAGNQAGFDTVEATPIENIISTVIYAFLGLVGVIFMVLVIYGGFIWMTAQGNEERVKKANGIILNALFGLMITLAAYVITYFLTNYLATGQLLPVSTPKI